MKSIELGRGAGKTSALIAYMLAPGNSDVIYVAPTQKQATAVGRAMFLAAGGTEAEASGRFISVAQLRDLPPRQRYVVDEADGVLSALFRNGEVHRIAFTPSDTRRTRFDVEAARRRLVELRAEIVELERTVNA